MELSNQSAPTVLNLSHAIKDNYTLQGEGQEDASRFERNVSLVVTVIFSLIIIFGLIGNLLVILVVSLNKHMRSSTNILLLNLAVADLSFILLCVIFTLCKFTGRWVFGDAWCKIMNYVNYLCAWVSVYTLVLLCIDRVLAIVFAMQLRRIRSMRNGVIAIAVVWMVASLANVPALLFHGELRYVAPDESPQRTCIFLLTVDEASKKAFQLCFFIFGFAFPVAIISVMYTILAVFIARKSGLTASNKTMGKAKKRVTVMVIVVVSAFVVCWLPLQILLLLNNFGLYENYNRVNIVMQIAANCLAYMNSCINPALYTMTSATFRSAFVDILCCRRNKRPKHEVTHRDSASKSTKIRNKNVLKNGMEEPKTSVEDIPLITAKQTSPAAS